MPRRRAEIVNEKVDTDPVQRFLQEPNPVNREEQMHAAEEEAQKELGDMYELIKVGEAATFDGLTKELDILDRIDAAIARCLKQLLHVRGVKSVSVAPPSASPKRIPAPSKAA